MRRLAAAVLLGAALTSGGPAEAHLLKLFVDVTGTTVSGYGFFIGGGRPRGAKVHVRDAAGGDIAVVTTDDDGRFSWSAPAPGAYALALDAGDGHVVTTTIAPERFVSGTSIPATGVAAPPTSVTARGAEAPAFVAGGSSPVDPRALGELVEASVDRALARRLAPMLEAQVAAEARLRFSDLMGGVGMIVGLAGLAAWAMARRRGGGPGA